MEQANRVPLMIHVPGKSGGETNTLVELMDLYPTLAELAGLEAPGNLQGDSLIRVLDNQGFDLGKVAISQYKRAGAYGYSMRTDRYRYTEWVMENGDVVYRDLYDMKNDPGETHNLKDSDAPGALAAKTALYAKIIDRMTTLQDPVLTHVPGWEAASSFTRDKAKI